jgi:hypothetical protein
MRLRIGAEDEVGRSGRLAQPVYLRQPVVLVRVIGVRTQRSRQMIVLGLILLIIGFVAGISILWTIGIILLVIGVVLFILGAIGREVGGRKYWY